MFGMVIGMLFALQRQLIYFPDSSSPPPAAQVVPGAREVTLTTSDDLMLGAWWVPPRGQDRKVAVLLAPGNGGNREGRAGIGVELSRQGFGVLLMDYRGYGGNPGSPSEQGLARDAEAAVSALAELGYPLSKTIFFGESIGSAVVARLAAEHPPAGVVLRSPFTSLTDVGRHHYPWLPVGILLKDRFPVTQFVRDLDVPVVVAYGDADRVVPPELSRRVAEATKRLADEVVLEGVDHNDEAMFGRRMAEVVAAFADSLH